MKRSILSLCVAMMFTVVLGMIFCCQNLYGETSDDNTAASKKDDFTVRIKDVKHKDGAIKITWSKVKKAEEYICTLYNSSGKDVLCDWETKKTNLIINNLNPGEKYIFEVYPQYMAKGDHYYIGGADAVLFTMPRKHARPVYNSSRTASDSLYRAIRKKEKKFVCYIPYSKKNLSADRLIDKALSEKRYGDYLRTNMWYLGEKKNKINIVPNDDYTGLKIKINGKRYTRYEYKLSYYTTAKQDREFENEAKKAVEKLNLKGTNAEKIEIVDRYIKNKVKNPKKRGRYNDLAYGALMRGEAYCTGKTALAYYLLKKGKVDCRIVEGGTHGRSKALIHYNILVKSGNKYYYYDVQNHKALIGKRDAKGYNYYLNSDKIKGKYRGKRIAQLGRDIGL